ncbi:hypothetical protein LINGRAHAP2_LOCUS21925 [Linum grandiflorum]
MAANHDSSWDEWLDEAISKLESTKLLRSLRPITLNKQQPPCSSSSPLGHAYKVFDEMQQWDRSSVEVSVSDSTFHSWLRNAASVGEFVNTWALYLVVCVISRCPCSYRRIGFCSLRIVVGVTFPDMLLQTKAHCASEMVTVILEISNLTCFDARIFSQKL